MKSPSLGVDRGGDILQGATPHACVFVPGRRARRSELDEQLHPRDRRNGEDERAAVSRDLEVAQPHPIRFGERVGRERVGVGEHLCADRRGVEPVADPADIDPQLGRLVQGAVDRVDRVPSGDLVVGGRCVDQRDVPKPGGRVGRAPDGDVEGRAAGVRRGQSKRKGN